MTAELSTTDTKIWNDDKSEISTLAGHCEKQCTNYTQDPTWNGQHNVTSDAYAVVTSDNVRFLIPSVLMPYDREKWNSACTPMADGMQMMVLKSTYETAETLGRFLRLMKDWAVSISHQETAKSIALATFLVKWEFAAPLRLLLLQLRARLDTRPLCPTAIFWTAAAADDALTCALALSKCLYFTWSSSGAGPVESRCLAKGSIWDSNSWSSWYRFSLRDEYAWALGKAYCEVGKSPKLAEKFLAHLAHVKGAPISNDLDIANDTGTKLASLEEVMVKASKAARRENKMSSIKRIMRKPDELPQAKEDKKEAKKGVVKEVKPATKNTTATAKVNSAR